MINILRLVRIFIYISLQFIAVWNESLTQIILAWSNFLTIIFPHIHSDRLQRDESQLINNQQTNELKAVAMCN